MNLIRYWKTSKNYVRIWGFWFLWRLILVHFLSCLEPIFGTKIVKINNKLCEKKKYIESSFGNYLVSSLNEYVQMNENYEPEIWKIINDKLLKLKQSDENYLINIWVNIWRWSIDLAKKFGLNVVAFEPAPETFEKLKINIALSWLTEKFELYNIALWDEEWKLDFEFIPFHTWGSHIVKKGGVLEWGNIIQVPVKRFDDLLIDNEIIDKTRLIIMDVEWFEANVLMGMENSLKKFHDISIMVEIWENNKESKEKVMNLMKNLKYSVKQIDKDNWLFTK